MMYPNKQGAKSTLKIVSSSVGSKKADIMAYF